MLRGVPLRRGPCRESRAQAQKPEPCAIGAGRAGATDEAAAAPADTTAAAVEDTTAPVEATVPAEEPVAEEPMADEPMADEPEVPEAEQSA